MIRSGAGQHLLGQCVVLAVAAWPLVAEAKEPPADGKLAASPTVETHDSATPAGPVDQLIP